MPCGADTGEYAVCVFQLRLLVQWIIAIVGVLMLGAGCAKDMAPLIQSLNEAHVSNCLFIQGAVPPYGTMILYAKAGDLDCLEIWKERLRLGP